MANHDAPNGFSFAGYFRDQTPHVHHFDISSGVVGTIGRGQPCKLDTSGEIVELNGTFANDAFANGKGIFICQKPCVASDQEVPFLDGAVGAWQVQADDDWPVTSEADLKAIIGAATRYAITNVNSISTDGLLRSIAELDGNGSHATANYLVPVDWVRDPANEFGALQKVIVRFHPGLFQTSPWHINLNVS